MELFYSIRCCKDYVDSIYIVVIAIAVKIPICLMIILSSGLVIRQVSPLLFVHQRLTGYLMSALSVILSLSQSKSTLPTNKSPYF